MTNCKPVVCASCGKYYCIAGCTFITEYYTPAIVSMVSRGELTKVGFGKNCKFCGNQTLYHFEDLI